jgi:hypothetical protein
MLHEETRAQWERYNPQVFIESVLHGTLQNKIKLTSTVVHVYTNHVPHSRNRNNDADRFSARRSADDEPA